jgi:lipoprotein-anchoring transpeptidase ErfK/SrfK
MLFPSSSPALRPVAFTAAAVLLLACGRSDPPGAAPAGSGKSGVMAGSPTLPSELAGKKGPATPSSAAAPATPPPEEDKGPWFAVTAGAAGVYSAPEFEKSAKLGYLRHGERVSVEPEPGSKKGCTSGWYKVRSGGFVCGNLGTTNMDDPEVKFATTSPKLDDVLPYLYARNAKNGTPLYKSVPSREQMLRYEPYLEKKEEKKDDAPPAAKVAEAPESVRPVSVSNDGDAGAAVALDPGMIDAGLGVEPDTGSVAEPEKPWWQQDDIKDRLHEVKLSQLEEDSDDILAKRMVTGFYVAVDRTFRWNGRLWYKTTRGLVTPSERFWQAAGSKFKGVELDGQKTKLPMAWVYGGRKNTSSYKLEGDELKPAATIERFVAVQLSGVFQKIRGNDYAETADGTFIRKAHLRITEPGPMPADVGPNERWVDVDLDSQTLVAFEGTRPVYATMISSGKESKEKDKDHRTPTGEWRIREKHVTTTMDGDGSAAGDLPYSIEDVPYVLYFHRSYALHGAFWHQNYGVQMSHGCVNLAPLDAKHVFFFTDPPLPKGFHGAWATPERPGSRVVVHE